MIERHDNPYTYITALQVPAIRVINSITYNKETSQYEADDYFVEADRYVRVYISPPRRKVIFSLSSKARDVYYYIIYTMNENYEYVNLSYDKYNDYTIECGGKEVYKRGFKESLKELVAHNIIDVKDVKSESYWISPNYFFPGDRIKKYPNNVLVVRTHDNRNAFERSMDGLK